MYKLRHIVLFQQKTLYFTLSLLATTHTFAKENSIETSDFTYFPLIPHTVIEGTLASGTAYGGAESLIPVYGTHDDGIVFTYIGGQYGYQDTFLATLGTGLRYITENQILGAYFFGDYTGTLGNGEFFVLNPGVQWMSPRWDANLNGYFPNEYKQKTKDLGFASDNDIYDFVSFAGHTQFDQELTQFDVVGNGLDAQVGYSFSRNHLKARIYAGAYHYAVPDASNITGGQIGVEYPINRRTSLTLSGSQDNVLDTQVALTLSVGFGKIKNDVSNDVSARLVDLIPRHLGTLGTAASIPDQRELENSGNNQVYRDNIWFFEEGTSTKTSVNADECTFENPCVGLNQAEINSINAQSPHANFYFAPGNYYSNPTPTPGTYTLAEGQSFWGRSTNYKAPAKGNERAKMNGIIELNGNNRLDSLQVINDSVLFNSNIVGINILNTATGHITMNNINVEVTDNANEGAISIVDQSNASFTLINSTLNATQNNTGSLSNGAINIALVGNSTATVMNSVLNVIDNSSRGANNFIVTGKNNVLIDDSVLNAKSTALSSGGAFGLIMDTGNTSTVTIKDSIINTTDDGGNTSSGVLLRASGTVIIEDTIFNAIQNGPNANFSGAFGVQLLDGGTATIKDSTFNIQDNGTNGGTAVIVRGVGATATMSDSTINIVETGTGQAVGVFAEGGGTISVDDSDFTITGTGSGLATGAESRGNSTVIVTESTFNMHSNSGPAMGAIARDSSNITIDNSNFKILSQSGVSSGVENNGTGIINVTESNFEIKGNAASQFNSGSGAVNRDDVTCRVNGNPC